MRWPSVSPVASVLAGCSLLYNPGNLPEAGDAHVADANPCALAITDIGPNVIDEGQGIGGSMPALVVLRGENIVNANLTVALAAVSGTVQLTPVTDAVASNDHRFVAFTVTAPIDSMLGKTGEVMVPLSITVTQDAAMAGGTCTSMASRSDLLKLRGLPELTSASRPEVNGSTVVTTDLKASGYSTVNLMDLPSPLTFANPAAPADSTPAIVRAISSITLPAVVADAVGSKPGPGGYEGRVGVGAGPGGGGLGTPATGTLGGTGGGGGGAGFALDGKAGDTVGGGGGTGGGGGRHTNDILPASVDDNRPSAGGGGGAGALSGGSPGGAGGGGGGVVVLVAGGNITTGTISAAGGNGADGGTGLGGSGGGGGAGAGGLVIASSDAGALTVGRVTVKTNPPGAPGGGTASVGRVRWDSQIGSGPLSPDRPAHRGPAFVVPMIATVPMRVFTTRSPMLTLVGTQNDGFQIRVTDHDHVVHDGGHGSFGSDNLALISPTLFPGFNRVCITLDGGKQGHPEADKCIDVAFLP